ncbi:hypothetical protein Q4S45_15970 [Massilia sp. R2A-15]|uniref:hypothetical protein n=1 Tax=Massilia sp. R2A-15 TaxID=3064278 RepID=UPI0027358892|nr:hypothetical protein [Massilia sp. R2A-15]WLI88222.1 hypothetical protein Q4S45_15970 [Massilia sp. R2A-15]
MELFFLRRLFCALALVVSGVGLTGCASIVDGTNQVVSVNTRMAGQIVDGAKCELSNDKGKFYVTTPGTVTIHRAYADLAVTCEKPSLPSGSATVKSSTKGMAMGNILVGGIIGAAVDASSGAAYDYPTMITVRMGEAIQLPFPVASSGHREVRDLNTQVAGHQRPRPASEPVPVAVPLPAPVEAPAHLADSTPAEQWEGVLNCVARDDSDGSQAKAYSYRVKMEMHGDTATMRRASGEVMEMLTGKVRADVLALSGTGYSQKTPGSVWQYRFSGEMREGAVNYLGKGDLLVKGKQPRACQVMLKRVAAPARAAESDTPAPAKT